MQVTVRNTELFQQPLRAMFDHCPETLLGLGCHDWTRWLLYHQSKRHWWYKRRCTRCGRTEWKRTKTSQTDG